MKIGDHVKASKASKHYGYQGIIVNADGAFLTIQDTSKPPNPKAYKSSYIGTAKYFQLDRNFAIKIKDKK